MARAELHQLIDELPDESIEPVAKLLRKAHDPMIAVLDAAPVDDEAVSQEESADLDAARTDAWVPLETVLMDPRERDAWHGRSSSSLAQPRPCDDRASSIAIGWGPPSRSCQLAMSGASKVAHEIGDASKRAIGA